MARMEFLFHNQRIVVQDIAADLVVEQGKLLTLIEHNASERTLERQERIVRRLQELVDRTPSARSAHA